MNPSSWVAKQELELDTSDSTEMTDELTDKEDENTLYAEFLRTVEPPLLRALLDASHGNRAAVAQKLGMHRSTLRQKMRNYEMET